MTADESKMPSVGNGPAKVPASAFAEISGFTACSCIPSPKVRTNVTATFRCVCAIPNRGRPRTAQVRLGRSPERAPRRCRRDRNSGLDNWRSDKAGKDVAEVHVRDIDSKLPKHDHCTWLSSSGRRRKPEGQIGVDLLPANIDNLLVGAAVVPEDDAREQRVGGTKRYLCGVCGASIRR
jgi:hypothetical protein